MDPDSLAARLAAGLVRVAVTAQHDTVPPGTAPTVERTIAQRADTLLGQVERLDEAEQRRVLALVTEQIATLQRQGRIPITRICLTCRFFDGYAHPGTAEPHHCWYVDAPFGYRQLRLRCPEQAVDDSPN